MDHDSLRGIELPPIEVLEIPDEFEFMDPQLQEMLRMMLAPDLALRCSGRQDG